MSDKRLLEQIERAAIEHQATGDELLDSLTQAMPQANPDFQQRLEDDLIARMQQIQQREVTMQNTVSYVEFPRKRNIQMPITLAAAMLLVVVFTSVIIFASRTPSGQPQMIAGAQGDNPTPTPIPSATDVPIFTPIPSIISANALNAFANVTGVINSLQTVNVREAPGNDSVTNDALIPGTVVTILGQDASGRWFNIEYVNDEGSTVQGWVSVSLVHVEPVAEVATPLPDDYSCTITILGAEDVQIYERPNANLVTTGVVTGGAILTVLEQVEEASITWYRVQSQSLDVPVAGWINANAINIPLVNCLPDANGMIIIPTVPPTPVPMEGLCQLTLFGADSARLYALPTTDSEILSVVNAGTLMSVLQRNEQPDSLIQWYRVEAIEGTEKLGGWIRSDFVTEITECPPLLIPVVIAVGQMSRGMTFTENIISIAYYPANIAPRNGFASTDSVMGKFANTDLIPWQPILADSVAESFEEVDAVFPVMLPPNTVAIAVPLNEQITAVQGLKAGDSVDVVVTMMFIETDGVPYGEIQVLPSVDENGNIIAPFTSNPSNIDPEDVKTTTQTFIHDAYVVHVGDFPADGSAPDANLSTEHADIITLAVSPDAAVVLTWLIEAEVKVELYPAGFCSDLITGSGIAANGEIFNFGGIKLDSYLIADGDGAVLVNAAWDMSESTVQQFRTFVHIYDESGALVGQENSSAYQLCGQTDFSTQTSRIKVAPGKYKVYIGIYDLTTNLRIPVTNADGESQPDDMALLGEVEVK